MSLMSKTVIRKEKGVKFELPSEREIFNGILNEAFKRYDALEKINQEQALEIARLKEENNKVRELVKNYEELEKMLGAGQPRFPLYKLQEILGDKENE